VTDVSGVREAALGGGHTCVRTDTGISCFGRSGARQLGDGRNDHSADPSGAPFWRAMPQPASVLAHPIRIAGGMDETCFLMPDSRVRCAGSDAFGELGGPGGFGVARAVFGIDDAGDVCVGLVHSCIVKRDGRLHCAGQNTQAQIGNVTDGIVMGVADAADVACGYVHTCVRRNDGTVACFGNHRLGQLGTSTLTDPGSCMGFVACSRTPQEVTGIDDAESIAAGFDHTCALHDDGTVSCWGDNELGQLGSAPRGQSRIPRPVTGLPPGDRVVEIDAGEDTTCAVVESGHVWCWGRVLGATGGSFTIDPTEVLGLTNVAEIAMSQSVMCARLRSGALRCLGNARFGELGDGVAIADTTAPVIPRFIEDATTIGCGFHHCCAVRTSGQAMCWGQGSGNQLGRPSTADSAVPISTYSLTRF
jgi:alpha-tubulin suppressor-like RCC1 family protein